jgi:hypothetical protein
LIDEHAPRVLVCGQRLGLAPGAIEREHQLTPEALPERVLVRQDLQLAGELGMPAEGEFCLDAPLEHGQPEVFEACDRGLRERVVRELG